MTATVEDSELAIEKRWMILARLNPEDFRRFYEKYCPRVYYFCLRRTLDPELAEDLTSETFLRAQRSIWKFRWQGVTFGAYLFRIALNLIRQRARRAAHMVSLDDAEVTIVDARISPLAEVVLTERQLAVRTVVAGLDRLGQEIFLLHYWEGMTTAEIAAVLGTPEGTVKTRLRRGRTYLRTQLQRLGIGSVRGPERDTLRPKEERKEDES